jgi:hypothetical protein
MKCAQVQRRLLAAERPDLVGADLAGHLAQCPSCHALQRRLVRLEHGIRHLSVPASTRRPGFVAQFMQQTPVELPVASRQTSPDLPAAGPPVLPLVKVTHRPATPAKERGLRKLAIAIAVAASLAIFAIGLWAMQVKGPQKLDERAVLRKQLDTRITYAETPRDKAEVVVDVAIEVQTRVENLAKEKVVNGKQLADLAELYRELVSEDLQTQVRVLVRDIKDTNQRREAVANLVSRLHATASACDQEALKDIRPEVQQPLKDIAAAARNADNMINEIILTTQVG